MSDFVIGEFGDLRLKKSVLVCSSGWSRNTLSAYGIWGKTVQEKLHLDGF